jgi:hypothetical protein
VRTRGSLADLRRPSGLVERVELEEAAVRLRLWNADTGAAIGVLSGHAGPVAVIAFNAAKEGWTSCLPISPTGPRAWPSSTRAALAFYTAHDAWLDYVGRVGGIGSRITLSRFWRLSGVSALSWEWSLAGSLACCSPVDEGGPICLAVLPLIRALNLSGYVGP